MNKSRPLVLSVSLLIVLTVAPLMTDAKETTIAKETTVSTAKKKIVLVAGPRSHSYGSHEHNAGCLMLADALQKSGLAVEVVVYQNGWPKRSDAFDGASTIIVFSDGAG